MWGGSTFAGFTALVVESTREQDRRHFQTPPIGRCHQRHGRDRHIPDELLVSAPDVPWKKIRGIGSILRHEYHKIADDVIWSVVTENMGPLRAAIERVANEAPE